MNEENSVNGSERRDLLRFLESRYDVPRERLFTWVNMENLPDEIEEFSFIRKKMVHSNDENVGHLTDKFYARVEYIDDFLNLNFNYPPGTRDGYINQSEVKDDMKYSLNSNRNLVTSSLVSEEDYDDLIRKISDQLDFLEDELENCEMTDEVRYQFHLVLSMMKYSVETKNSANIKNSFRAMKYLCSNHSISSGRHDHGYSKIGRKLDSLFDNKSTVSDKLYPYYSENMKSLVNCVEECLSRLED